jgi:uncharacterized membrane protein
MKKIFYILLVWLLNFSYIFAATNKESNTSEKRKEFFDKFFSLETLVNVILVILVIIITFVLMKFTSRKLTQYLEKK